MSSRRRPLSANFKKDEEKRSRPGSAKSSGSASRHSLSSTYRSDVSNNSELSITGTKTAQIRPRQKQSLSSLTEKKASFSTTYRPRQNNNEPFSPSARSSKNKMKIKSTEEDTGNAAEGAEQTKNNRYSPPDPIQALEAEDYRWWENIPEDISFSPASSLSFSPSRSEKPGKKNNTELGVPKDEPFNKLSFSTRNPSLTDFLDFPDDAKSALPEENSKNVEQKNDAADFQSSVPEDWSLPQEVPVANETSEKFELDNEAAAFQSGTPREESQSLSKEHVLHRGVEQENAALTIQRWYRGYKTRLNVGYSAIQKVLEEKRLLREQRKKEEERQNLDVEKQRRREEKARFARQTAIQELNQKREHKREENKQTAGAELKFLEESGKVIKAKSKVKTSKKQVKKKSNLSTDDRSVKDDASDRLSRPGTANTLESKVEELFQESRKSASVGVGPQHIESECVSESTTSRTERMSRNSVVGGATTSTLDDLFESLRQLEEEPSDVRDKQKQNHYGWLDQVGTKVEDNESDASELKLTQCAVRQSHGNNSSLLSQQKLRTIMSFLDEVEKTDQDTIVSRVQGPKTFGEVSPSASITLPRVDAEKELVFLESASAAACDVTNAMMSVKVELEEKKKTNELLQRALNQQREFSLRQARDMDKDTKQRLELQRQEYESTIQRHLSFIDQLIDDKKTLSERCEELVKKLKETDKKYVDKITKMEESHSAEIKKQKDIMQTAEKLRREKWVKEKSQQIKELTVKGLEPDIQKLIAKHKAELKKLKCVHQAEVLETDERVGRRYLHQIEELRDQLEREKETACNRERDLAQTRFQKQMEEEEQAFQQQRRRLYAEIQEEKERMATQAQKQRKELDELKEKLEESHRKTMGGLEVTSKRSLEELEQKHQLEMKEMKERLEIEKQQWIENYMKKQDAMLMQKERELKEGVRESRDKEIELVIRRLEEETALAREECERAAENRIKRVRDKYESEIKELEQSEKSMHEKYTSVKEQSNELEEEVSRLKVGLKNEERKLVDLKKLTGQLQDERGQVVDIIRQEFADRLVTTDEDNKRLKIEMSELRAKHRLEIERTTNLKEEEMNEVHKRVKQAISKKEETLNTLRQQKESAEKRSDHLEFLLQEQRKKFLS